MALLSIGLAIVKDGIDEFRNWDIQWIPSEHLTLFHFQVEQYEKHLKYSKKHTHISMSKMRRTVEIEYTGVN